jgi:hypothetical protein
MHVKLSAPGRRLDARPSDDGELTSQAKQYRRLVRPASLARLRRESATARTMKSYSVSILPLHNAVPMLTRLLDSNGSECEIRKLSARSAWPLQRA